MGTDMSNLEQHASTCYNFFVNLFDNGEFNEIVVTQNQDGYSVNLEDNTFLGTLAQNSDHSWSLVKGNMPAYLFNEIIKSINQKIKN
jgi:hypothetical protein